MTRRIHPLFAWIASIIVGVAVVWGFAIVGSPATERLRKLDERRIIDLKTIHSEIQNIVYGETPYSRRGEMPVKPLPKTLEEIAQSARERRVPVRDAATGEPYEYRVIDETHFELCATFALPRDRSHDVAWNHPAARHCFSFDVRTQSRTP